MALPPPVDRMTRACENTSFPQLRWGAVQVGVKPILQLFLLFNTQPIAIIHAIAISIVQLIVSVNTP